MAGPARPHAAPHASSTSTPSAIATQNISGQPRRGDGAPPRSRLRNVVRPETACKARHAAAGRPPRAGRARRHARRPVTWTWPIGNAAVWNLTAASLAVLNCQGAWQPLTKLRSPQDYVIALMRAGSVSTDTVICISTLAGQLGEPVWQPPFDGLAAVAPYGDPSLARLRASIMSPQPGRHAACSTLAASSGCIPRS